MALYRILINNTWYILPIPDKADTFDALDKTNDSKYMTPKTTMDLINSLENIGGIKEVDISGTGNAITSLEPSADGMTLIATKDSTFLTDITIQDGNDESGKYISHIEIDESDKHKINVIKTDLPAGTHIIFSDSEPEEKKKDTLWAKII